MKCFLLAASLIIAIAATEGMLHNHAAYTKVKALKNQDVVRYLPSARFRNCAY